ncbi:hypothetical protein BJX64DRAFT_252092 [Aspergillus heterothallicus]
MMWFFAINATIILPFSKPPTQAQKFMRHRKRKYGEGRIMQDTKRSLMRRLTSVSRPPTTLSMGGGLGIRPWCLSAEVGR